ncbi:MAG: secondary thiamine-phosphate synthase enzyme YjbQ, partial [Syntrophorhabdaceae bacterium]|nr:secondary thiamine-phosphate synthase enzyme YjbQ [Syntrophorhabdaceae bacterium]
MVYNNTIKIETKGFGDTIDITEKVRHILKISGIENGIVTIFCPGSTGTITTIEFESGVIRDLKNALERLVPSDIPYDHDYRWHDGNGFSHVRAALMKPSLTIPVIDGEMTLGMWQQVVFIDF